MRAVHLSSWKRVMCPAQTRYRYLTFLIIYVTFVLYVTQVCVCVCEERENDVPNLTGVRTPIFTLSSHLADRPTNPRFVGYHNILPHNTVV